MCPNHGSGYSRAVRWFAFCSSGKTRTSSGLVNGIRFWTYFFTFSGVIWKKRSWWFIWWSYGNQKKRSHHIFFHLVDHQNGVDIVIRSLTWIWCVIIASKALSHHTHHHNGTTVYPSFCSLSILFAAWSATKRISVFFKGGRSQYAILKCQANCFYRYFMVPDQTENQGIIKIRGIPIPCFKSSFGWLLRLIIFR